MGLRASFKSLLETYNCKKGDYGLKLIITHKDANDPENTTLKDTEI